MITQEQAINSVDDLLSHTREKFITFHGWSDLEWERFKNSLHDLIGELCEDKEHERNLAP